MVFSVDGDTFEVDTWTPEGIGSAEKLNSGIVLLKALYGRDTDGNGTVDVYDTTTPPDNASWRNVLAVRMVMVARSGQRERDEVTTAEPTWNARRQRAVTYIAYPGANDRLRSRGHDVRAAAADQPPERLEALPLQGVRHRSAGAQPDVERRKMEHAMNRTFEGLALQRIGHCRAASTARRCCSR